jgi:hypothetical protein
MDPAGAAMDIPNAPGVYRRSGGSRAALPAIEREPQYYEGVWSIADATQGPGIRIDYRTYRVFKGPILAHARQLGSSFRL